ncbi:putative aliphatic sulfonates transport permease protein SsuC [bioreactor metagenome]|uniref:Putative aliphatic sulfonates transport permease protein SsuC n=1 Tax=bioreactor metagenome TaxID=1076179 RepID=A0A645AFJ8_9ZZZZ
MVISVKSAIQGVSPLLIRVARTLSYSNIRLFIKVIIPAGLPGIITGLRLAWAFAWRSLMAGELLGSGAGLGQVLITGRNLGDMSLVISVMLIVGVLGSIIDLLLFQRLETGVLEKWGHTNSG